MSVWAGWQCPTEGKLFRYAQMLSVFFYMKDKISPLPTSYQVLMKVWEGNLISAVFPMSTTKGDAGVEGGYTGCVTGSWEHWTTWPLNSNPNRSLSRGCTSTVLSSSCLGLGLNQEWETAPHIIQPVSCPLPNWVQCQEFLLTFEIEAASLERCLLLNWFNMFNFSI